MRTVRLPLVGTVILVLLCGPSGAVLAQDQPMEPALVTGTETCTGGQIETTQMDGYTLLPREGRVPDPARGHRGLRGLELRGALAGPLHR